MSEDQIQEKKSNFKNLVAVLVCLWMSGFLAVIYRVYVLRLLFGPREALSIAYLFIAFALYVLSKKIYKRETWLIFVARFAIIFVIMFMLNVVLVALLSGG